MSIQEGLNAAGAVDYQTYNWVDAAAQSLHAL